MEAKTYTTIDRTNWLPGPWDGEPDKTQWQDEATGFPCLAVRHPHFLFWCGYVGVPETHPLHGKDYNDADVEVHGGLTYADKCRPSTDESKGICHVAGEGEPDSVWWLGFDCGHCFDHSPKDAIEGRDRGYPFGVMADTQYRTLAYVREQCSNLAAQLKIADCPQKAPPQSDTTVA